MLRPSSKPFQIRAPKPLLHEVTWQIKTNNHPSRKNEQNKGLQDDLTTTIPTSNRDPKPEEFKLKIMKNMNSKVRQVRAQTPEKYEVKIQRYTR